VLLVLVVFDLSTIGVLLVRALIIKVSLSQLDTEIAPCHYSFLLDFLSYSLASDGESLSGSLLLGETGSLLVSLGDTGRLLVALEFDMAVGGKVGRNSTMGSVSSSASRDGSLADGVVDNTSVDIKSLISGLSVSSEVNKEVLDSLDGLLGPSTKLVLEDLALGVTADTTGVNSEGDNLSVFKTGIHVFDGLVNLETLAGSGNIVRVLVMDSQVVDLGHGGYISKKEQTLEEKKQSEGRTFGGLCRLSGVFNHCESIPIY